MLQSIQAGDLDQERFQEALGRQESESTQRQQRLGRKISRRENERKDGSAWTIEVDSQKKFCEALSRIDGKFRDALKEEVVILAVEVPKTHDVACAPQLICQEFTGGQNQTRLIDLPVEITHLYGRSIG